MSTSQSTPQMTTREVWQSAPVRRLLIANGILYSGIALQSTALLKQAYDITGRKSDLGWMGLAEFIPIFALVLVTGSVADHFKRKTIAMITVGAEVFTSAALMSTRLLGSIASMISSAVAPSSLSSSSS